jgi:hypothetical protein
VAIKPDVIVVQSTPAIAALLRATSTIPIVFTLVSDPVDSGIVDNLARPGGNVLYVLSELQATVTTFAIDGNTGQLSEVGSVSGLPADSKLVPGMPRGAVGTPSANQAPRNTDNDIWAADIHMTPDEWYQRGQ